MKIKINKNIVWANLFAKMISNFGIKHVCVSPGSRNTPFLFALEKEESLKKYVIVDERSSGFFALGIAKKSKEAVCLITTSGTALAELYPAIIEAYKYRGPLFICTADRPDDLIDCGANQTIFQNGIYNNHIRFFANIGLPALEQSAIDKYKNTIAEAYSICVNKNRGPVHLNFPFDKPFEPSVTTDEIDDKLLNCFFADFPHLEGNNHNYSCTKNIIDDINSSEKVLFIIGHDLDYSPDMLALAKKGNIPVLVDGLSDNRYKNSDNLIVNYDLVLRNKQLAKELDADVIFQIGNAPTSTALLEYLATTKGKLFSVNEYGDLLTPSRNQTEIIACSPNVFCHSISDKIFSDNGKKSYFVKWHNLNAKAQAYKDELLRGNSFPNEPEVINEILSSIPSSVPVMISNSLPPRDTDWFADNISRDGSIFVNRGASGIDGIVSTAAGICAAGNSHALLITGELSFYHDMNGLHNLKKYNLPLVIVLINNDGGGIFEMLPASKEEIDFNYYFKTPLNIAFRPFIEGYGGNYYAPHSLSEFKNCLDAALKSDEFSVIELFTNSKESHDIRKTFWATSEKLIAKD